MMIRFGKALTQIGLKVVLIGLFASRGALGQSLDYLDYGYVFNNPQVDYTCFSETSTSSVWICIDYTIQPSQVDSWTQTLLENWQATAVDNCVLTYPLEIIDINPPIGSDCSGEVKCYQAAVRFDRIRENTGMVLTPRCIYGFLCCDWGLCDGRRRLQSSIENPPNEGFGRGFCDTADECSCNCGQKLPFSELYNALGISLLLPVENDDNEIVIPPSDERINDYDSSCLLPADCPGCLVACDTMASTIGDCKLDITVQCDTPWRGAICVTCGENGAFSFVDAANAGLSIGTEDPITCELPVNPLKLTEYQATCADEQGNTATVMISPLDMASSSKGGKGRKTRRALKERHDQLDDKQAVRGLRKMGKRKKSSNTKSAKNSKKGKGSNEPDQVCAFPVAV